MVKDNSLIIQTQVYFFVIFFNLAIAVINLFVIVQIWRLRQLLARVTVTLVVLENSISYIVQIKPELMKKIKLETNNLKAQREEIEIKLEKIRKILVLISIIYGIGQQWQLRKAKGFKTIAPIKFYNSF